MRQTVLTICLCIIVAATSGCGGAATSTISAEPTAAPEIFIGYAAPEMSIGQTIIMQSLVDHAEAKGWSVQFSNANSNAERQAEQIAHFIEIGVDAIVAVPIDSQSVCAVVEQAHAAGIEFFTIDRAPTGCAIEMTVLSDNYLAGVQSGEALVELLTEKYGEPRGTILELQGDLRQNVAQLRGGGFHSIVDQYPNIEIISRETQWQSERFAGEAQDVLSTQPVDAIYMHSDCVGTPVVLPVMNELGLKHPAGSAEHIFMAGVDGCTGTLQAIRDGFVDQSSSQPMTDFGIIVDWMERSMNGDTTETGEVVQDGAPWSPAHITESDTGLQLLLATTSVRESNVTADYLWGNQS